jgi:hypothetical protein
VTIFFLVDFDLPEDIEQYFACLMFSNWFFVIFNLFSLSQSIIVGCICHLTLQTLFYFDLL